MNTKALASSADAFTSKVFSIIQGGTVQNIAGDSTTPVYSLSQTQIDEIRGLQEAQVQSNYITNGQTFQSLDECRKDIQCKIAGDIAFNPKTGIGTLMDPSIFTHSTVPIMMGLHEETALYASGGLPADIIDKKSHAMTLNGVSGKAISDKFWNNDRIEQLEQTAFMTGLNDVLGDGICSTHIYGGSIVYPIFKEESPTSFITPIDKLNLEKDCIDRWVTIDRWNITTVPSYKVMQKDYINPKSMFIPQECVEIDTSRMAILRPKPMPYWAVLYNLGWSPSDFCGWMRAYYGYEITMQSIPVMAQQMSLLLYKMPLDALNATLTPDAIKKLMEVNEEKMSEWSAVNPKAVNMVGDVEVVNRTYSGFDHFIGSMKSNLASQCDIPEPVLWHTPNKGFSDNTTESLLKQSESLRMKQKFIERSLRPIRDILIAATWGKDSEEYKHKDELQLTLSKPTISTEKDMAEAGARFAASVSSFAASGVAPDIAIKLTAPFFPSVKVSQTLIDEAKKSYDEAKEQEMKIGMQKMQAMGGQSNQGPKTQAPNNGKGAAPMQKPKGGK